MIRLKTSFNLTQKCLVYHLLMLSTEISDRHRISSKYLDDYDPVDYDYDLIELKIFHF